MNVPTEITTAIKTLHAAIIMVHLVAFAILDSLEMESFVKVCLICVMINLKEQLIFMNNFFLPEYLIRYFVFFLKKSLVPISIFRNKCMYTRK